MRIAAFNAKRGGNTMYATRRRRIRSRERQTWYALHPWYALHRQWRFARRLGFINELPGEGPAGRCVDVIARAGRLGRSPAFG
jgi:hypothetical protein